MNRKGAKDMLLSKLEKELSSCLYYHNITHILDVYNAAKYIANAEGVTKLSFEMIATAALFHDSGFIIQAKDHEKFSCDIAKQYLPEFGYSYEQILAICGMIMATKIPQSPKNLNEQILADADLDYLGRNDFEEISNKLFQELMLAGSITDEKEWDKRQIKFLQDHNYFTATSQQLRNDQKIVTLQKLINKNLKINEKSSFT